MPETILQQADADFDAWADAYLAAWEVELRIQLASEAEPDEQ